MARFALSTTLTTRCTCALSQCVTNGDHVYPSHRLIHLPNATPAHPRLHERFLRRLFRTVEIAERDRERPANTGVLALVEPLEVDGAHHLSKGHHTPERFTRPRQSPRTGLSPPGEAATPRHPVRSSMFRPPRRCGAAMRAAAVRQRLSLSCGVSSGCWVGRLRWLYWLRFDVDCRCCAERS